MWVQIPLLTLMYKIKNPGINYFTINNNSLKKINIFDFQFLTKNSPKFLYKSIFIYYNFLNKFVSNYKPQNNFIFLFNKHKWHYSFNFLKNFKTITFFSLGSILKYLNIDEKCLRRTKKGFLIYLNIIFNVFKKLNIFQLNILINFFDSKLIYFKKRFSKYTNLEMFFNKVSFFNFNFKFKKHKSIKRRLTKKFYKKL